MSGQLSLVSRPGVHVGRVERSCERVLTRWRHTGHEVDEVTSAALRAAGRAVDAAERDRLDERASALSVSRCVAVLWSVYRDAAPGEVEHDLDDLDELPAGLADLDADD